MKFKQDGCVVSSALNGSTLNETRATDDTNADTISSLSSFLSAVHFD